MHDLRLRKAGPNDVIQISELGQKIWRQHYPGIITPEQIEFMLNKGYQPEVLQQLMLSGHEFYLMEIDGKATGFCAIEHSAPGSIYLHKLYTDSSLKLPRMGSLFLDYLLLNFPLTQTIDLRVNRFNQKAIQFYLKRGFQIVATDILEIGNGFVMDDYLMKKEINL